MRWPSSARGHMSVQVRHWQQAAVARRRWVAVEIFRDVTTGWSRGRTRYPEVVLVTGWSRSGNSQPIIGPPSITATSARSAPPAAAITSAADVPMGAS